MEIGELVNVAIPPAEESPLGSKDCEWMCTTSQSGAHQKKWHEQKPSYPKGGKAKRDKGAPKAWKDAGLVPWLYPEKDDGVNSLHADAEYHYARHLKSSAYPYPTYATEGHHCISCEAFSQENYPALVHNALLMGYDINCKENGYHVPAYIVDIVCHNLQHHASQHTWSAPKDLEYNLDDKLSDLLSNLQDVSMNYCRLDEEGSTEPQKMILEDLNRLSDLVRREIKSWRWFLAKLSKMTLGEVSRYGQPAPKKEAFSEKNLKPSGFPDWDYYVAEGLKALKAGANPREPFSRWVSRKMLEDKRAGGD